MDFRSEQASLTLQGRRFFLKGINWFGCEGELNTVHGIWSRRLEDFLDLLARNRFNAVRLPFTAELALDLDGTEPGSINYDQNPSLKGKSAGQVLDHLIAEAAKRGMLIMLDMHCLTRASGITELWHNEHISEAKLIEAWSKIVSRYLHSWNVFAADLKNEPHGCATWGDGSANDWRLAAQRIGNAILAVNPKLLIFVEGIAGASHQIGQNAVWSFWGGNLAAARTAPVQLQIPGKLVYSPHVYGPGVSMQEYFKSADFPANMPGIWLRQWAHLLQQPVDGPAVIVGEWGGFFREGEPERAWAEAFVHFLQAMGATDTFFWCLNPNSGDTGGLLEDDWTTPVSYKLLMLHRLCPDPSSIQVDSSGQPIGITFGGNFSQPPEVAVAPTTPIPPAETLQSSQGHNMATSAERGTIESRISPSCSVSSRLVTQWADGSGSSFYHVEFELKNAGDSVLPDVRFRVTPEGSLSQIWNVAQASEAVFGLPEWLVRSGGLKPQETFSFGGIFRDVPQPALVVDG